MGNAGIAHHLGIGTAAVAYTWTPWGPLVGLASRNGVWDCLFTALRPRSSPRYAALSGMDLADAITVLGSELKVHVIFNECGFRYQTISNAAPGPIKQL